MKILTLHSNSIQVTPTKQAIKEADEKAEPLSAKEALVVFTAVEDGDVPENVARQFKDEVIAVFDQVKAKEIVVYPYVHLTSKPSKPEFAKKTFEIIMKELKGYKVKQAPFGFYKAFDISVKGHPLAELSREIKGVAKERGGKQDKKKGTKRTEKELEEYAEHDHRRIGKDLDLFSFHEFAPGQPFFHNKGFAILEQLKNFMASELAKRGYLRVQAPVLWEREIFEKSGHWTHYRENLFTLDAGGREFGIKPMNCPGHAAIYKTRTRSYRDLPLRFSEWTTLYRNELSGVLSGLFRVMSITQDDAHIYCREDQIEAEIDSLIEFMKVVYDKFGFKFKALLSTRPENKLGDDKLWDKAEATLEKALKKHKIEYKINKGDGAFYGPKIDTLIVDSLGRDWQCATIQLDYNHAERFDVSYVGEDGKNHRPVVIHRAIYGSFERFLGNLIEHYKGNFPTWLAPTQVVVLSITNENEKYAQQVFESLKKYGIRTEIDIRNETLQNKIREHSLQKVPYLIVVGKKEEDAKTIAIRNREGKTQYGVKPETFIEQVKKECAF